MYKLSDLPGYGIHHLGCEKSKGADAFRQRICSCAMQINSGVCGCLRRISLGNQASDDPGQHIAHSAGRHAGISSGVDENADDHRRAFFARSCKNASRICFLSA